MKIRIFQSGKGDCLLLTSSDGKNILVDGGHEGSGASNYTDNVARFLGSMQEDGKILDLVYVSHIDQDHIGGVLTLLNDLFDWKVYDYQVSQNLDPEEPRNPRPPEVAAIWHNAFHEQINKNSGDISDAIAAAALQSYAMGDEPPAHGHNFFGDLATSMNEAVRVSRRIGSSQLGIPLNEDFGGKLAMRRGDDPVISLGDFDITVLGPTRKHLRDLRKEWNKWLKKQAEHADGRGGQIGKIERDSIADERLLGSSELNQMFLDLIGPAIGRRSSVSKPNVASLLLCIEEDGKKILLTGDGRDDHILDGLIDAGISDSDGHVHVDVLKIPHHGSKNNMSADFAKCVTADHYVFCGDGGHHNPYPKVVKQLIDSRIGSDSQRSSNPEVDRPFKLWFSSSEDWNSGSKADHMRELEDMVRERQQESGGKLTYRFSKRKSIVLTI